MKKMPSTVHTKAARDRRRTFVNDALSSDDPTILCSNAENIRIPTKMSPSTSSPRSLPSSPFKLGAAFAALFQSAAGSVFNAIADEDYPQNLRAMRRHGDRRPDEGLYGAQTFVHTFGTSDACARKCPRACVAQELEELMDMQRWICPNKAIPQLTPNPLTSYSAITPAYDFGHQSESFHFSSQFLLILVPLGLLTLMLILIVWCRKCSAQSA
ncbi:hypothetical protein DdX_17112 [Ditylenchus destructor]|uniref:Uncharacterized protein n=1 Tax=Ditylenchus destructor TaxID=166010 RepID=A0AAD4MMV7_9BILA|nr:hypothetical protein DdX_17112 [Ditylenchus destructor]